MGGKGSCQQALPKTLAPFLQMLSKMRLTTCSEASLTSLVRLERGTESEPQTTQYIPHQRSGRKAYLLVHMMAKYPILPLHSVPAK